MRGLLKIDLCEKGEKGKNEGELKFVFIKINR
jgi:hypothetical protein